MLDLGITGARRKWTIAALFATIVLCLGATAAPALAAKVYEVDTTGDETDMTPGNGECLTSLSTCTLRAAIEEANADGVPSSIVFKPTPFDGGHGSNIEPGSAFPPITQPVVIDGGSCVFSGNPTPCAGFRVHNGQVGFEVLAGETTIEHMTISEGTDAIRIEVSGSPSAGVDVLDNTILAPSNGIEVTGSIDAPGNLIEGNTIDATANDGIVILGGGNRVFGNKIDGSEFIAIYLHGTADGNRIGGDTPESENVITNSYGAIVIVLPEAPRNEIGRNRGESTGGPFILLNPEGTTPNGGIAAPTVTAAVQSSLSGSAEAGAKVRVFESGPLGINAIEGFLGEAVAGSDGTWKATFPAVPVGTLLTATQTLDGGTSELSEAVAATAEPSSGGETGGGTSGGANGNPAPAPAPSAPDTKITKGPKEKTHSTTATFKFTSTVAGSSFECKLDKTRFKKCKSPKTYKHLARGLHLFRVRAVGPTGLADKSAAKLSFKVLAKP